MNGLNILLDATCIAAGALTGASRYVRVLVSALAARDNRNRYTIFGFEPDPFANLPGNFRYLQARKYDFLGPAAREVSRRLFVSKTCADGEFDVAHFVLDMAPVRVERTKTVFTLFDLARLDPHYQKSVEDQPIRAWWRTCMRYGSARSADRIVTTSQASKEAIRQKLCIPAEKIEVAFISCDPAFTPGPPDEEVLGRFGVTGRPYALFVGQFGRQKNEDGLIEAFLAARRAGGLPEDAALVLAGDDSAATEKTRALLDPGEIRGRVILAGRVSDADLVHLYRGARCVCLPSFHEGYGLPVQEAMACGTPSIVSNTTSLPELAGPSGIAVPPGDQDALADAVGRVLSDDALRNSLAVAALARASSFSLEGMAQRHMEIYQGAAERG